MATTEAGQPPQHHQNGEQNGGGPTLPRVKTQGDLGGEGQPRYSSQFIGVCLLGYSLSFIIFGSQVSILGPTISPLAERLGVAEPDLSPLFTALGVACIISGTPSGWLVDRVPTHRVLLGSLLVQVGVHHASGAVPPPRNARRCSSCAVAPS